MDKDLVQKLKWCERELAGLKQAHERGLGVVNFFSETASNTMLFDYTATTMKITVQFGDVDYQPFCQAYISEPEYFQPTDISWDGENSQLILYYYCYVNGASLTVDTKVIASADIGSVTLEAVYG